uniref:InfA n=1 Tax=Terminalia neotaliala TaxID=1799636 RepID=A0A859CQF7_9MYRT|nr:InfA [Terminalia neotaliala]QKJ81540.1 InfA [Terminalia neotaliala]
MFGVRLHNEDLIPSSILFKGYDGVVYVYYWDKVKMEISRYTSTRKRRNYRLRNKDSKGLARIQKIRWFFFSTSTFPSGDRILGSRNLFSSNKYIRN